MDRLQKSNMGNDLKIQIHRLHHENSDSIGLGWIPAFGVFFFFKASQVILVHWSSPNSSFFKHGELRLREGNHHQMLRLMTGTEGTKLKAQTLLLSTYTYIIHWKHLWAPLRLIKRTEFPQKSPHSPFCSIYSSSHHNFLPLL